MAAYDPLPAQSPIDLIGAQPIEYRFPPGHVALAWRHKERVVLNDKGPLGREVEFEDSRSYMMVELPGHNQQTKFTLKKLHFHAPNEHRIKPTLSPLELHIVHTAEEPDPLNPGDYREIYAVIGVSVEKLKVKPPKGSVGPKAKRERQEVASGSTECFQCFRELLEGGKDCGDGGEVFGIDPHALLPYGDGTPLIKTDFWRYEGSLTSDRFNPNKGHVSWFVLKDVLSVDTPEVNKWTDKLTHKAKLFQPLDRRFVFFHPGSTPDPGTRKL